MTHPEAREWIDKAEGDYRVALREYRVRTDPCHEAVCLHAQQCVEKYLKAVLVNRGLPLRSRNDPAVLLRDLAGAFPLWVAMTPDVERLAHYALKASEPGEIATRAHAREAVMSLERCRSMIREGLGFPP